MNRLGLLVATLGAAASLTACHAEQLFGSDNASADASASGGAGVGGAGAGAATGEGGQDLALPAGPASDFKWLNPLPHGNDFRAVDASSDNNVWVGGRGEVLSWNGLAWKTHVPVQEDVSYHALWANSPSDVWAGGTELTWEDEQPVERAVLLHFDGSSWKAAADLGAESIVAIHGPASNLLMALPGGAIRKLQGNDWVSDGDLDHDIRALWVNGTDDAWAVGDDGFIARRTSAGWVQMTGSAGGDPFGADRHYLGVWASAPDDVWAIFDTSHSKIERLEGVKVGFSHYDGTSWRVARTAEADCAQHVDFTERLLPAKHGSADSLTPAAARGSYMLRRGALLRGRSGGDILASVGGSRCLWHYDGADWTPIVQEHKDPIEDQNGNTWAYLDFPLGLAPSLAATSSGFFIAGKAGQLVSLDPTVPAPPVPHLELAPALTELFPAARPDLRQVIVHATGTYALADDRPAIWTAEGWHTLLGPPGSLEPSSLGTPEDRKYQKHLSTHLHMDARGRLWTFGGHRGPYAAKWDGVAWLQVQLPELEPSGLTNYQAQSVWSSPSGAVWFTNYRGLYHLVDGAFEQLEVRAPEGYDIVGPRSVTGSSDGDIWFKLVMTPAGYNSPTSCVNMRFDGQSFAQMAPNGVAWCHSIHAFAPDKVLLTQSDKVKWLYDGEQWEQLDWPMPPFPIWSSLNYESEASWARDVDDFYAIGRDTHGSHVFHFNGISWVRTFSADDLKSVHSDGSGLWVVGDSGATARGVLPDAPPR